MRSFDLHPADFLHLDLFPAEVVDGSIEATLGNELRVVVTENYLYVFMDTPDGADLWFKEPLTEFSGTNKTGYRVETGSNTYHVKRAPSCGCGASLRGLHLFPDAVYLKPTP